MKTKWKHFAWMLTVCLVLLAVTATAGASMLIPSSQKAKENAKAPEKSPVISVTESGEWELGRVDFIHYAKPTNPVKPAKPPKTLTCYELLGVKWKTAPVEYVINPVNSDGLTEEFILNTIAASMETWDDAASVELVNNSYGVDYSAQYGLQDFTNAIVFDDYADDNVIAVTSIWYTRKGKQIVEFDMLFNSKFVWGDATINPAVMDLQNIAVHEAGHGLGMGDIYADACSEATMYGYGIEGEIKKRTLESPDIAGLQIMYGL